MRKPSLSAVLFALGLLILGVGGLVFGSLKLLDQSEFDETGGLIFTGTALLLFLGSILASRS